jgi:hypothetical protein
MTTISLNVPGSALTGVAYLSLLARRKHQTLLRYAAGVGGMLNGGPLDANVRRRRQYVGERSMCCYRRCDNRGLAHLERRKRAGLGCLKHGMVNIHF